MMGFFAVALIVTTWSLATLADPPRATSAPKTDSAGPVKPSTTPARSKGPSGAAAQAAPAGPALKSEPEGPEAEGKVRAQAVFGQAVAAYKEGRYFDAIELFLETNRIYPDPNARNKSFPWGGMVLTEYPTYPDSYRPGLLSDSIFATDTSLGFSGGDVAPMIQGSRFRVFDN